jgi:LacI family transcriptional regulator
MPQKISPPTLRDIAEEVGVTASTVSAVLNNAPKSLRYTEATKARIRETATRLGYTSNPPTMWTVPTMGIY